jgi:hypothetical protein
VAAKWGPSVLFQMSATRALAVGFKVTDSARARKTMMVKVQGFAIGCRV